MPKAANPKIASANDLLGGQVVYLERNGTWGLDRSLAAVSDDSDELEALIAAAPREPQVIDVALIDVALDDGEAPRPTALREIIRDRGPTVRPDLGRQAVHDAQQFDGSSYHV
jgi:hypothetical protein